MNPNPYSPPAADLSPASGVAAPRSVHTACTLIIASFVLSMLTLLPGMRTPTPDEQELGLVPMLVMLALFGGLTVWLTVKIKLGRNWARWAMLAYMMLGWLMGGLDFTETFLQSPVAGLLEVVCNGMEIAGCWLLFSGASAQWFRELSARARKAGSHSAHP